MPGSVPRWFIRPQTVTHPGTNLAWRRVTSLTESNMLHYTKPATHCLAVHYHLLKTYHKSAMNACHVLYYYNMKIVRIGTTTKKGKKLN